MATTFLNLTNRLLRKLNEVELTSSTFPDARGVHITAQDAINDAIEEINKAEFEWPFNAYEHTQSLVVGQEEYSWPDNFKVVDWHSFQIQKDDTLNIKSQRLKYLNRDEWYKKYKDLDDDAESDGISVPKYVFESHGSGFGISPSPDETYSLKFRYYIHPTRLSLYSDESTIPSQYDHVIITKALHHMYMFFDNTERAVLLQQQFERELKHMRTLLINKYDHVEDTRVKF